LGKLKFYQNVPVPIMGQIPVSIHVGIKLMLIYAQISAVQKKEVFTT